MRQLTNYIGLFLVILGVPIIGMCQPARIDPCWVIETKGCYDQAAYDLEAEMKLYCETTACERHEETTTVDGTVITRVWYTCPKSQANYMTNETYQEKRKVYGDTVGIKEVQGFGSAHCRQKYACKGRCIGPGNCERGNTMGLPTDQRESWIPRSQEGCRGPAESGGPLVIE